MKLKLYKYHGAGKDFIVIDDRSNLFPHNYDSGYKNILVSNLCDPILGLGAKGLILFQNHHTHDFGIVYFNENGKQDIICADAGRCGVAFATFLEVGVNIFQFSNENRSYLAEIENNLVKLKMPGVKEVSIADIPAYFVDNVTLFCLQFGQKTNSYETWNVKKIIYGIDRQTHQREFTETVNCNEIKQRVPNDLEIKFEQDGEDEALIYGTGAVASAVSYFFSYFKKRVANSAKIVKIISEWGDIRVDFDYSSFLLSSEVWLVASTKLVFCAEIDTEFFNESQMRRPSKCLADV